MWLLLLRSYYQNSKNNNRKRIRVGTNFLLFWGFGESKQTTRNEELEELEERKDSGKIIEEMVKYADTVEDKLTVSKISMSFREILGTEGL